MRKGSLIQNGTLSLPTPKSQRMRIIWLHDTQSERDHSSVISSPSKSQSRQTLSDTPGQPHAQTNARNLKPFVNGTIEVRVYRLPFSNRLCLPSFTSRHGTRRAAIARPCDRFDSHDFAHP